MPDWNLDLPFDTEPTRIPTGDECTEQCSHSDCSTCGREVAAQYRQVRSPSGIVWLAGEVVRVAEKHGANIPDGAVSMGDLARVHAARNGNKWDALDRPAWAWAEGVCEALTGTGDVVVPYRTAAENDTHVAGVQLVKAWQAEQLRLRAEAQAMADADITSAAVAQQAEQPRSPQGVVRADPGFESRAQHRGHGVR